MVAFKEFTTLDYRYTDYVLLADALMDTSRREADILDRQEVIDQIKAKQFDTRPEVFAESLVYACNARYGEYLSARSLSSLKRMRTYKVKDLPVGFALSRMKGVPGFCEIVAVHNASPYSRLGMYLLATAEELGGAYLQCFGNVLSGRLYTAFGFEIYKTIPNVTMRNGTFEDLHFMKLKWFPIPAE